ncbi:MAG: tRNA adenosine(34) deaminase TadA [Chlamydiia bacterium]|nr:tRNA adenosine(34) deaminase TadA [Chlamydiia bacterium]
MSLDPEGVLKEIVPTTEDERWMKRALKWAVKAYKSGEVPVGAVLVHQGEEIASGYNQVELLRDATAHAEMLCLTSGQEVYGDWRLEECTLYTTIEPCAMCAGALLLTRVPRLVWGAPDLRHGANGSWVDLFAQRHPTHTVEITSGVLDAYCGRLMQEFFRERRREHAREDGDDSR